MIQACGDLAFDESAQVIAAQQLPTLMLHLSYWAKDDYQLHDFAADSTLRAKLLASIHPADVIKPGSAWNVRLHDLGVALGLLTRAQFILAQYCHQRGWFDQDKTKHRFRPRLNDILTELVGVLQSVDGIRIRAQALVERHLCRDLATAILVARSFLPPNLAVEIAKITLARLHAWVRYGNLGLLAHSGYPLYQELCRSEDFLQKRGLGQKDDAITLVLRTDIWALYSTFQAIHPPLWHANLLVEPPHSVMRQRYQSKLFPKLQERLVASLAEIRQCSADEAATLLRLYQGEGIPGFIAWRTSTPVAARVQSRELDKVLEYLCYGLEQSLQAEVKYHLEHIFAAATESVFALSLNTTIRDRPSSFRRLALKRRLRPNPHQANHVTEKQLSEAYARRVDLDAPSARFRIRNLLTYGILGLIPRDVWYSIIDQRLLGWFNLIKLGHPDDSLAWRDIYARAIDYCDLYAIPHYASPLLQSLFNSLPKQRHWHGGKGLATLNIHQRIPLTVTNRPRLHAEWLVFVIPLDLVVAAQTDRSYLTLVADSETQLPVGGWLSSHMPAQREVGLALYQAIWHVGAVDFPLRGIPKIIKVPRVLAQDDMFELQVAAHYLMSHLDIVSTLSLRGKRHLLEFVGAVKAWAIQKQMLTGELYVPPIAAFRELMEWMQIHSFPFHRQNPPPASVRATGHALPGFDTPAAGWLLPVVGIATVRRGHIVVDKHVYPVPASIADGIDVPYRRLPIFLPNNEALDDPAHIFIEISAPDRPCLYALTATR